MSRDRVIAYIVGFGGPALLGIAAWIFHLYVRRANARDDAAEAAAQRVTEHDMRVEVKAGT